MAWLNAIPKAEKRALGDRSEPVSRLAEMREQGLSPALPDLSLPLFVEWLMEVGPTASGPMGSTAIGWRDIDAWQRLTAVPLEPWHAKLLRRLSGEYLAEFQEAGKPDRPAPYVPDATSEAQRDAVADKVRSLFGGRAARV